MNLSFMTESVTSLSVLKKKQFAIHRKKKRTQPALVLQYGVPFVKDEIASNFIFYGWHPILQRLEREKQKI